MIHNTVLTIFIALNVFNVLNLFVLFTKTIKLQLVFTTVTITSAVKLCRNTNISHLHYINITETNIIVTSIQHYADDEFHQFIGTFLPPSSLSDFGRGIKFYDSDSFKYDESTVSHLHVLPPTF